MSESLEFHGGKEDPHGWLHPASHPPVILREGTLDAPQQHRTLPNGWIYVVLPDPHTSPDAWPNPWRWYLAQRLLSRDDREAIRTAATDADALAVLERPRVRQDPHWEGAKDRRLRSRTPTLSPLRPNLAQQATRSLGFRRTT